MRSSMLAGATPSAGRIELQAEAIPPHRPVTEAYAVESKPPPVETGVLFQRKESHVNFHQQQLHPRRLREEPVGGEVMQATKKLELLCALYGPHTQSADGSVKAVPDNRGA